MQAQIGEKVLRGIPVSPGVCRGKLLVLGTAEQEIRRLEMTEGDVPLQLERFQQSLMQSRQQLIDLRRRVSHDMGLRDAEIFDAQLLILEDPMLVDQVTQQIEADQVNAEFALHRILDKYLEVLLGVNDELLRERAADVRDVGQRIMNNLLGCLDDSHLRHLSEPHIMISHDLAPTTTALLDKSLVLGFGTDIGSRTSHTAILARGLQIPAVVGLKTASQELATGQYALLDGFNGLVILNPTDQTLFEYGQIVRKQVNLQESLRDLKDKPAVSLDGHRIILSANIEQTADCEAVKECGAEGVGLFRTEFLFLNREAPPDEDEQYEAYRTVAEALKPQPVVIRTLDIGGDKFLTQVNVTRETGSFYGWRAIRFCLHEKDLFRAQMRAILRASAAGNVKMMYPMVCSAEELDEANRLLDVCKNELRIEGASFDDAMEVGVMIEIPSAALAAETLASRVKFFSIGTNDLIQYTLAVDRMNEKVAHLYQPTHPAVLRLIKMAVDAAHNHGLWVGVCGEMAGDPVLVPLLLGMGVDELSVAPPSVPQIKFLTRRIKMFEARQVAQFALICDSAAEILDRSRELARKVAPSLFQITQ